jgi:dipeptidyl-peptidase-4
MFRLPSQVISAAALAALIPTLAPAQDRLPSMPGADNYTRMAPVYSQNPRVSGAVAGGGGGGGGRGGIGGGGGAGAAGGLDWSANGRTLQFSHNGKRYSVDIPGRRLGEVPAAAPAPTAPAQAGAPARGGAPPAAAAAGGRGGRVGGPGGGGNARCDVSLAVPRGRQVPVAESPDGRLLGIHKNRNLYIANADCSGEYAVTTDGTEANNIKYGTGSWVYGEELGQNTAMWWNRASTRLAYYRFLSQGSETWKEQDGDQNSASEQSKTFRERLKCHKILTPLI